MIATGLPLLPHTGTTSTFSVRKPGAHVDLAIEARVRVRVWDVDRLAGERRLSREALAQSQADLGRGPLRDARPDLLLLLVDDVEGAALRVDGLGTQLDQAAQIRLAVSLHRQMPELHEDERDLVVKHVDQCDPATTAVPMAIFIAGAALGFASAPMRLIW